MKLPPRKFGKKFDPDTRWEVTSILYPKGGGKPTTATIKLIATDKPELIQDAKELKEEGVQDSPDMSRQNLPKRRQYEYANLYANAQRSRLASIFPVGSRACFRNPERVESKGLKRENNSQGWVIKNVQGNMVTLQSDGSPETHRIPARMLRRLRRHKKNKGPRGGFASRSKKRKDAIDALPKNSDTQLYSNALTDEKEDAKYKAMCKQLEARKQKHNDAANANKGKVGTHQQIAAENTEREIAAEEEHVANTSSSAAQSQMAKALKTGFDKGGSTFYFETRDGKARREFRWEWIPLPKKTELSDIGTVSLYKNQKNRLSSRMARRKNWIKITPTDGCYGSFDDIIQDIIEKGSATGKKNKLKKVQFQNIHVWREYLARQVARAVKDKKQFLGFYVGNHAYWRGDKSTRKNFFDLPVVKLVKEVKADKQETSEQQQNWTVQDGNGKEINVPQAQLTPIRPQWIDFNRKGIFTDHQDKKMQESGPWGFLSSVRNQGNQLLATPFFKSLRVQFREEDNPIISEEFAGHDGSTFEVTAVKKEKVKLKGSEKWILQKELKANDPAVKRGSFLGFVNSVAEMKTSVKQRTFLKDGTAKFRLLQNGEPNPKIKDYKNTGKYNEKKGGKITAVRGNKVQLEGMDKWIPQHHLISLTVPTKRRRLLFGFAKLVQEVQEACAAAGTELPM